MVVYSPIRLPWSSGHDFRLSLTPISAGDRGSIPRGRVSFCVFASLIGPCEILFSIIIRLNRILYSVTN